MRKLLLTLITILPIWSLYAQQPIMCVPPYNFPVSASGPGTVTNIPATTAVKYSVSNAAYDNAGNLRFFVKDNRIFDASGNFLSYLTSTSEMYLGNNEVIEFAPWADKEIAIVPIPKVCNQYYVIHAITSATTGVSRCIVYEKVDCSLPTPVVSMSNAALGSNPYVLSTAAAFNKSGIAIRKTNVNGNKYLYTTEKNGLVRYDITSTGINNRSTLCLYGFFSSSGSAGVMYTNELEISPDGKFLAWGVSDLISSDNGKVFRFSLTDPNLITDHGGLSSLFPLTITLPSSNITTNICGLEFSANNTLFISADLSGGGSKGIFKSTSGSTSATLISGTDDYLSFLERRLDDQIYMVNITNGQYAKLNPTTNAITTIPLATITAYSNFPTVISPGDIYTLPDQIDGENYAAFNTLNDLIIKDEPLDMGIEPTVTGLNIWEGDIWNCNSSNTCLTNEDPYTYATDYMRVRVTNIGCVNSLPADLHMYWTRGRSGEIWNDHWLDPSIIPSNTINGHPGGGEITVTGISTPAPISIPSIPPGGDIVLTKSWTVPNGNWYPVDPNYPAGSDGINPMICFLGRIVSANDPMNLETLNTAISDNVRNNNNIATRNSQIITISIHHPISVDGSFMINNPRNERFPIEGIRLTGLDFGPGIDDLESVSIQLDPRLYDRWVANGRRGTSIIDMGHNIIKILDYRIAEISNVQILPGEEFTIVPMVELNRYSTLKEPTKLYSFMINHFYRDGSTRSAGVYHVEYNDVEVAVDDEGRIIRRKMQNETDQTKSYVNEIGNTEIALDYKWQNEVNVSLYTLNGEMLLNKPMKISDNHKLEIDTKNYAKGMYILNISNAYYTKSIKLTF